jgi:cellulose synthase/poly-beta-1,6-N-acetylglucosamine synthase-like glycosyltransferase
MTKIFFWASIFFIFYTYLGYPLISLFLGIFFKKRINRGDFFPSLSLIIPAFNEESVIREKLENSLKLDYPKQKLEIIVCSESTDNTNSIVKEYSKRRVKLVEFSGRQGKSKMLYNTVPLSKGQVLVFSDANSIYSKNALIKLSGNFADSAIAAVAGKLSITNSKFSAISAGESWYKKYENIIRRFDSLRHSVIGVDGAMFALRREAYFPLSPERGDDFELAVEVLIRNKGVVFEPEAVCFEKASLASQVEIKRKIRIVSWFLKSFFILLSKMFSPFKPGLIFRMISHKLLRWFSPYFFISLFFASFFLLKQGFFFKLIFISQSIFYFFGALGWLLKERKKVIIPLALKIPFYFLVVNYAFLAGTVAAARQKQRPFWEKSQR